MEKNRSSLSEGGYYIEERDNPQFPFSVPALACTPSSPHTLPKESIRICLVAMEAAPTCWGKSTAVPQPRLAPFLMPRTLGPEQLVAGTTDSWVCFQAGRGDPGRVSVHAKQCYKNEPGVSVVAERVRNPTSTHEDVDSIPGLAQGVKGSGIAISCSIGHGCS